MGDLFLLFVLVAGLAVVWIEWIPPRYAVLTQVACALSLLPAGLRWLPAWHGWVTLIVIAAVPGWAYFSPKRRREWPDLFKLPGIAAREMVGLLRGTVVQPVRSGANQEGPLQPVAERSQVIAGAAVHRDTNGVAAGEKILECCAAFGIFVLSPLSAIPWILALVIALTAGNAVAGNLPDVENGTRVVLQYILGGTFITMIAVLDVMVRYAFFSVPVFLATAYTV